MKQMQWILAVGSLVVGMAIGWQLHPPATPRASAENAADSARHTLAVVDPLERSIRWHSLLDRAGEDALPGLRDAVAKASLEAGDPEIVSFAMWWARFDPRSALDWTATEWRAQSRLVVSAIFRIWAHAEPETAFAQLEHVAEFHRSAAIDAAIVGWFESGEPGLVEQIQSVPDDVRRQTMGESLARRIVLIRGTEGATRWLDSIADRDFRESMALRVASAASQQGDAAAAAAWATPQVSSGDARPSGYPRRIGTRWILRDPKSALAWLASLPAGQDRDDGVAESFRDWKRYAPYAAEAWIQMTPVERWSEPAFAIQARGMVRHSPEQALELVARFSDEALRNRTMIVMVRDWAQRNPEAARAWLAKATIPDDVRERVFPPAKAQGGTAKN